MFILYANHAMLRDFLKRMYVHSHWRDQDATHLQELEKKLESWHDDGWLEQCCANLAEQLRIAQAENAELQQEVEALR